ncbi:hypothetical protein LZZ85_17240 [Terrimonas sp. NA20]|uniref:Bacterial Pleckstrin homology domain-containing protein n=1 Tax=Terrimonas ginsenosidimutans TaxID=2908004 RepID=A0ABS9KUV9_9BACT|nr:hypothetical protein [Terrimonas ginsenosidimutans]MCG2616044.1 hypothetical protein [Terrimonas ginsenosidimutans]
MLYREEQRLRNNFLWIIAAVIFVLLGLGLWANKANGSLVTMYVTSILIVVAVLGLAASLKLVVTVQETGIGIVLRWLQSKPVMIKWEDIASISREQVNPVKDFGGWGLRYNKRATGYIFRGREGVRVRLKSGREFVITTDNGEALIDAVRSVHHELVM